MITQEGGIEYLIQSWSKVFQTTKTDKYTVVTHPQTGKVYHIMTDGRVVTESGEFVTMGGFKSLIAYSTYIKEGTTQVTSDYSVSVDGHTNIRYKVFTDGTVTLLDGTFVTRGGYGGLIKYLTKQATSTTTTTTTTTTTSSTTTEIGEEHEQFSLVTIPHSGRQFKVYNNGTVTTIKGVFVTVGGMEGLTVWLKKMMTQTATREVEYEIAKDPETGDLYRIWTNGTVTTITGEIITHGGRDGLKAYLT